MDTQATKPRTSVTRGREPSEIKIPPSHCEYCSGPCDQLFEGTPETSTVILYPTKPNIIAATIEEAAATIRKSSPAIKIITWKDFDVTGQLIFCAICKTLRFTSLVVADVTTLNFNLMFEIGYAIGLGIPVIPIRDTTFIRDKKLFNELGMLDTLGYLDFQSSKDLVDAIPTHDRSPFISKVSPINIKEPLYVVKSKIHTEGMVKLMSSLKRSGLKFRSFDPREEPRLSLHEAHKNVHMSMAVIVHLVTPEREDANVQNARAALVAGMAMAAGKDVLMLQESEVHQPIDYRDVVRYYVNPSKVPDLVIPVVKSVVEKLQTSQSVDRNTQIDLLEKVDMGDPAAENEIRGLRSYFVPTSQFNEAKRGRVRLVVGRKGSGKSALFYGILEAFRNSRSHLILDLKPEGHQLIKLRESIMSGYLAGSQQQILTAFWNYLLLVEIAHKILVDDRSSAYRSTTTLNAYSRIEELYGDISHAEQGDFSERLLMLVDRIIERGGSTKNITEMPKVTELVYELDIKSLEDSIRDYLACSRKESIWLLFDNLDKGWPVQEAQSQDILLLRSLLEATRKIQRQFQHRHISFSSLVFLRSDIYQLLVRETPDRGKESAVGIDWDDPELFKEIFRRRFTASTGLGGAFDQMWPRVFESHIDGESSFAYMLNRSLMRPREFLRFVKTCIDIALNRSHDRVYEEDILFGEKSHSNDALVDITLELKDVFPKFTDVPYAFIGAPAVISNAQLSLILDSAQVDGSEQSRVIDLLLWFGFLGFSEVGEEGKYSYEFQHDLKKMKYFLRSMKKFVIHPVFRMALGSGSDFDQDWSPD